MGLQFPPMKGRCPSDQGTPCPSPRSGGRVEPGLDPLRAGVGAEAGIATPTTVQARSQLAPGPQEEEVRLNTQLSRGSFWGRVSAPESQNAMESAGL